MTPTTFPTNHGLLTMDELSDRLMYACYKEQRRSGTTHENCVAHLGMPESYRIRLAEEITQKLSAAFFGVDEEEENEEE